MGRFSSARGAKIEKKDEKKNRREEINKVKGELGRGNWEVWQAVRLLEWEGFRCGREE